MALRSGIEQFADEVNSSVIGEVMGWRDDPELGRIVKALQSHGDRKAFLDSYAEAMVARHLRGRDCQLRFEVPTPTGRRCDFEVTRNNVKFYLHVKRLDTDRPPHNPRQLFAATSQLSMRSRPVATPPWRTRLPAVRMFRLITTPFQRCTC